MRYWITHILLLLAVITAHAATVRVDAPPQVEINTSFQIVFYVSNASSADCNISFPKDLGWASYVYGPVRGGMHTSSITIVNGRQSSSSSSSTTLTYTYRAKRKGRFSIPGATITVDGHSYKTSPRSIEVVEDGGYDPFGGPPSVGSPVPSADPFTQTAGNPVSENDAFVRVEMSKPTVYEQEAVVGSVKLYTRYPGRVQCTKLPQFDGFLIEELQVDRNNPKPEVTTVKGQKYYCFEMSRYILYPQKSGKLTVTPGEYDITVQQHDVFSIFGNHISIPEETTIHVRSNTAAVDITPLPSPRPTGFSGAVGTFKVTSSLTPGTMKTYSPNTFSLVVSGTGNLKYIQAPTIVFPKEFDTYDPQTNLSAASAGSDDVSGQVKFDYRIIPQFVGDYTIPEVKFIYFDTSTQRYETITVPSRKVKVEKGAGKPSSHYKLRNKDIADIDRSELSPLKDHNHFVKSWLYWLAYLVLGALLLAFIPVYRKWQRDHADAGLMRTRRANKVARKRLKKARTLIGANDTSAFYAEVLNAMWGYLSDKLSIPRSELNKENVTSEMEKYGFNETMRDKTIDMLDKCEFAQYAPELASGNLNEVYDKVAALMDELENVKLAKPQNKDRDTMNNDDNPFSPIVPILLAMIMTATSAFAAQQPSPDSLINKANAAYDAHNYQQALELYTQVTDSFGSSAALYYNMGNAAYRLKDRGHAVLYYEKALKIDPTHDHARENLQFIREKSQLDLNNAESWFNTILGTNGWATVALVAFVLALIAVAVVVASESSLRRLIAFYSAIVLGVVTIAALVMAFHMHRLQGDGRHAVIVNSEVVGLSSPHADNTKQKGEKSIKLDEGMKVKVIDRMGKKAQQSKAEAAWYKIQTADNLQTWVAANDIEFI